VNDAIYVLRRIYKYKKEKERTNVNICKYKNIINMTSRKLLQDLKAGFQEPRTERGDRRITSIPFYIREISIEKIAFVCFCHGGIGPKKGHDMNWRVLRHT